MTALSQLILDRYQVRKTKKQKNEFISLLKEHFSELQVQEGGFPKNRNLILGDVESAQILLTAHYDTCAVLPFPNFITPKNIFLSILYSLVIVIPIFALNYLVQYILGFITDSFIVHYIALLVVMFGALSLLMAGPANKHTANDNTSGVITLCEIIAAMTPEERRKVAVVFFDNEENGLLGSAYFRKRYKKIMSNKLLINFDCVSDGDNILVAVSKDARKTLGDKLANCFQSDLEKQVRMEDAEKVYYPSDQAGFKQSVAIAALKHNRFLGYYMDRIHTNKDTVFDEYNINFLTRATIRLIQEYI